MVSYGFHLRGLLPSDFDFLKTIENNPQLWRFSTTHGPFTDSELQAYIYTGSTQANQARFVLSDARQKPLGFVDLYAIQACQKQAKVGIVVADHHRQQGHGLRALQLLESIAYNKLNINELFAEVGADNPASIGLFQKAGYTKTATHSRWSIRDLVMREYLCFHKINDHV